MAYKSWRLAADALDQYIVMIEWNDTEGKPGICYYGPFDRATAENFAQNFAEDDPELGEVEIYFLNTVELVEED